MIVDLHAHYFPDKFIDIAARLIDRDLAELTRFRAPGAGLSPEEMIDQLDQAGIDMQILSPAALLPAVNRREHATEAASATNDIYAEFVHRYPAHFAAFGVVPLPHVDEAIEEAARCLDELDAVGIAVGCSVADRELDDPAFEPFWQELDRRGTAIFLHPVGTSQPSLNAYNLNWVIGAPFEDTIAALRLVLSGVTNRYPAIRVIVPHMGGTIPFLMARIDEAIGRVARSADVAIELPVSQHLRRLRYDTSNRNPEALRCAAATLGPEALVLGTDYPYSLGDRLRENVSYVEETLTDPAVAADVLGVSAATLLGLDARPSC